MVAVEQNKDKLMTRAEVEEVFGIPKRYLEKAVRFGNGPPRVNLGRSVRYRVSDIQSWIAENIARGAD